MINHSTIQNRTLSSFPARNRAIPPSKEKTCEPPRGEKYPPSDTIGVDSFSWGRATAGAAAGALVWPVGLITNFLKGGQLGASMWVDSGLPEEVGFISGPAIGGVLGYAASLATLGAVSALGPVSGALALGTSALFGAVSWGFTKPLFPEDNLNFFKSSSQVAKS